MARVAPSLRWLAPLAALLAPALATSAPIAPDSPTGDWIEISYPTLLPDFALDEQTGIRESDIVGDAAHPAFYMQFDDAGTPSATDGSLAFRVRLGGDKNPAGFEAIFGVGLDADLDGAIDLILAVDNTGGDELAIFDPGTDLNTSPSTTSIATPPLRSYVETALNYDWSPVDGTIDPTATVFDFDGEGDTDHFLSFVVPFQDVVDELANAGIAGFDEDAGFGLIAFTSRQHNALNQDIGGPNGGVNSDSTWSALGAMSVPLTPTGTLVPEPGTGSLLLLGLAGLGVVRRRRP